VRPLLLAGVISAAFLYPALAQTAGAPLIIDQSRQDRIQQAPPDHAPPVPQLPPADALAAVKPFVLKGVAIQGTSLAPALLGAATQSYVGKTADAALIQAIAKAVSDAYAGSGDIAFYTVTVPRQDFIGGVLTLIVTEGHVEHVDLTGDVDGDTSRVVALADRLTHETPLKRSTLQRCLSLIRDLPGVSIDPKLVAGQTPGGLRLVLALTRKRFNVALTVNNGGNALLGRTQAQADLSLYDLLREGEETKLSFGTSTLLNRYQYYGLSHSEALDDDGTRASLAFGYLHTDIGALALSGNARTLQLAVSHPVIRSFDENLSVSGSIDGIDSTNALLGTLLASEDVRALRLGAGYSLTDAVSALSVNANISQGLDGLGSRLSTAADPSFRKLVLQGLYNHMWGTQWVTRLKGVTQLAGSRLPISELYALGGPDYGRAFLAAVAEGDSALAGSGEVAFLPNGLGPYLRGLELFGFADDGQSWYRARPTTLAGNYHLASVGAGFRLPIGDKSRLEIQAADAIASNIPGFGRGAWRFLFGFTVRQ